jgi:hypothetical protein
MQAVLGGRARRLCCTSGLRRPGWSISPPCGTVTPQGDALGAVLDRIGYSRAIGPVGVRRAAKLASRGAAWASADARRGVFVPPRHAALATSGTSFIAKKPHQFTASG